MTAAFRYPFAFLLLVAPLAAAPPERVRFNRDVRPVLADACFHCHGPAKQTAGVRLDSFDAATRPAKSGERPVVPGDLAASELVRRVLSDDESERMPPPESHKKLTAEQKAVLQNWVAQGAVYEPHWAFVTPEKPAGDGHSIDRFLTAELHRRGLAMNVEADRPTLIRRAAFTLTGLPPTPAEVEAFVRDASPDAYAKMIDRYLASPRYGEEMARHWLDLARYADTHGLHLDNVRSMWPYRDWVVNAFNANQPFDQFTVEQLAGDLLPNATREQLVATGFNRCNVTTSEGGSINEEWLYRYAVDRTAAFSEAWLGLTAGCAACHDHKFDPLPAREFYSLYAFFYNAAGPAMDGNALLHEPSLKLSTPEQDRQLADFSRQLKELAREIAEKTRAANYADPADDGWFGPPPQASDPQISFRAWLSAQGGKDKARLPDHIKKTLTAVTRRADKPKPEQLELLRNYYLQHVCEATKDSLGALVAQRDKLQSERDQLVASIPATMIFRDEAKPRQAFVMVRGQYDKPGDKVEPDTPAVLPPLTKSGERANRLDLARWLVSPRHPLTSRVTVNRFWQQVFGTGLVKSSADFGLQGEPPSHPELLDWLAVTFRESGWDVKALMRQMVLSQAFRQSSRLSPEALRLDPENRWYARGPRIRLAAEQLRDNALFVSGLMDATAGGPGVKPYQPPNIWEPVGFVGSNTRHYTVDTGPALYRRSLYTFLKRTAPPPYVSNFDGPNREQPCSRRERGNTPLQALQLMNDVQHVEAARALAGRMMESGMTAEDRIDFAFRVVLSRRPTAEETSVVLVQLRKHLTRYRQAPDDAKKLIRQGESKPPAVDAVELASYTMVANMILNLDETINRN